MGAFSLQPGTDIDVIYDEDADVNDKLQPLNHIVEYTEPSPKLQQQKRVARQVLVGPPSRLPGRRPVQSAPEQIPDLFEPLATQHGIDDAYDNDQYRVDDGDDEVSQTLPVRKATTAPPPQQRGRAVPQQQRAQPRHVSRSPLRNGSHNGAGGDYDDGGGGADDDVTGIDQLTPVAYFDVHSKNVRKHMREMADALASCQEAMVNANRSMTMLEKTKIGQRQTRPRPPPQQTPSGQKAPREIVNDF